MQLPMTAPIQKTVVLLGAGNAHLRFVKMFGMAPIPGVAVTLVSEASVIPYSAMVPAHIGGDYAWDQMTIDLVRLCGWAGVRFLAGRSEGIDTARRRVLFPSRPGLGYDVLSIGVGSAAALPADLTPGENSWPMRPLHLFIKRLDRLEESLRQSPRPFHLVVVGGGASGCELTLAIRKRFNGVPGFRLTLVHGTDRLLPQFPVKAAAYFTTLMGTNDVRVRCNARVTTADQVSLEINGKEKLDCDAVLWATNAAPPGLLQHAGLKVSPDGFLLVNDTLQSVSDPAVFGSGDCIAIEQHPNLLKNGVYAVRQGGVLFQNIGRFLREQPLIRFEPQTRCLCLLNTSDGQAVLTYGPVAWKGRLARWIKDRIDRAWVVGFTHLPAMTPTESGEDEPSQMRCGGCGNKISSDVLSAVLREIDVGDDPRVLLGVRGGEDAAVFRFKPELFGSEPDRLVEVQTVDYFKSFVDDPFLFGRIAALNSVSDLYAMNARPFSALAIATLPHARGPVQEAMLHELLSGAVRSLRELGVTLVGGHTTEGTDLALGFAVTGHAEEGRLFQKRQLQIGDRLILTKPLGSGALLAAWMRGECRAEWFDSLIEWMLLPNDRAARIFAEAGVTACTDVTGFGLAGHLLEMLDASTVAAELDVARLPLYIGFAEVTGRGILSTLHRDNAKASCRVEAPSPVPACLFDPQTSGGLIAAVKPEAVEAVLAALVATGHREAAVIGEILPGPAVLKLRAGT